ncbi:MAG TPA: 4Fe-4S dicluster domain-containing protein [Anaeromyxobacteraceae bacterium]
MKTLPIYGQSPRRQPGQRPLWTSLDDLEETARRPEGEFPPGAAEAPAAFSRRSFMKLVGASAALAGLEACHPPREKIHPYVKHPREGLPGQTSHYATALTLDGYATGLVLTAVDGRPVKVEGNPAHPTSLGAAGVFEQAALLDLYDPARAQGFRRRGRALAWRTLLSEIAALSAEHAQDGGAQLAFLLAPDASPLLADLRRRLQARFPRARFHHWSPLAEDQAAEGARIAFGQVLDAQPRLDKADVILSLDADFLAGPGDALRLAREFARRREPGESMNRLYLAEPALTVTGAMADHRFRMRGSEVAGFARAVAGALGAIPAEAALPAGREARAVAADLLRHRGRSLALAGPRQPAAVHALCHAMNAALGNAGETVRYTAPVLGEARADPRALSVLAKQVEAGAVKTLVVTAWNPVHAAPAGLDLGALLAKVENAIYLTLREDETSRRASWVLAAAHPFESWGDGRARDGTVTLQQPLIAPLRESTTAVDLLAAFLVEGDKGAHDHLKTLWQARSGPDFVLSWERWLEQGLVPGTAEPAVAAPVRIDAVAAAARAAPAAGKGLEIAFAQDYSLLDGRFAPNAWLQELPDPVTKISWDNAAYLSSGTAKRLGLENGQRVTLTHRGRSLEVPVWIQPGHADEALTLPLGYGRTADGPVGKGVGFDAYRLRAAEAPWFDVGLALAAAKGTHRFAVAQGHFSMEGRPIALDFTQDEWRHEAHELDELRGPNPTLQTPVDYSRQDYAWGMAIDLSKCVGCNACVVACQEENNIPVVGKEQVAKGRIMHWIRVDRYFEGPASDPQVISQPLACVHCEAAPCEYVCPVNATVHSDEGLNEMIYNRCVGTRYCSNNCPYKVRRFNFLAWRGEVAPTEKMLFNPEVTLRSRGVMEKCTYCVQRIERARIDARALGGKIEHVQSACQQACPAEAIVFGNLNDPKARVSRLHRDARRYDLLHNLGTRPRTAYLVRIRNPNPELG